MRPIRFAQAFVATLFLFATLSVAGYQQHQPIPPNMANPGMAPPLTNDTRVTSDPDDGMKNIQLRQQNARNAERQKKLVSDTEKLLALATQLHTDVGKTDKNILSVDVVKRAEEIEKLARSVKDRMRG